MHIFLMEEEELEEVLGRMMDYAVEKGIMKEDGIVYRDLFDTKIMSMLVPRPSEVISKFWQIYKEKGAKAATDYYYKLSKDSDYTLAYQNNTNVGLASVVVTGKGNYTGTITSTFVINPKGTSISGKVKAQRRGFLVKWKKQTKNMAGYQVQYSTSRKFTKKATVTKSVKKSAVKLNVKRLKANKKYYVRVRVYHKVKGSKYYSGWSKVKSVKTKK